jgi:hypothetical protein
MKQSNQEVVKHLNDINESLRKTYAAQDKENPVSRSGSRNKRSASKQTQQTSSNQSQQTQTSSQNSSSPSRSRNRSPKKEPDMELGSDNQDRMQKLRERFNEVEGENSE